MSQRLILLISTLLLTFTACSEVLDLDSQPLISFLVQPAPPSECLQECLEPLKRPLIDFVNEEITLNSKDHICNAYRQTTSCVKNATKCNADDQIVVKKFSYGFNWACGGHGYDPFKYINPCIVNLGHEIRKKNNCTKKCEATIDSSLFKNTSNVIGQLEPICQPIACYLNCTAKQINSYCPTGGTRLINVVVSAFDEIVNEFKKSSRPTQSYIRDLVPEKCRLFFSEKEMVRLRFDEHFVKDVFYMIASRRQKDPYIARTEAERILEALLKKFEDQMSDPEPLSWDFRAVSICAAILVIMLLNIIALVFTIWWCATSKDENGELLVTSEAAMTHFVEPNIRMKLKLPKIRADAIHDSSQDVFELRVPRNGNQFHQNDEQTVVVPRYKRRRTYSVPLEPRPRTQSTGSDQLPHIVIVRNHEH